MKNVKIECSGARKAGASLAASMVADFFTKLGLTVLHTGDTVVVSGEVPVAEPAQPMMAMEAAKPLSILQESHQVIYGDREDTYGDPGKNLRTIATYWNTHIKAAKSMDVHLTEADVAGMMRLLKEARLANNPTHRDSLVDVAGYAGLQDRIQNNL